ncbi:flagellar type III secretion system pore protein FliP [Anaeromyxobacter diazotrophicus]|uniref:Flagellar biosynthetic protein FliP n=1 Tax=Anaeromyxobacter diazotrophicus TaxID=2590199 RepID=A0A7I9VRY2_9BACT|nr:flagellar type III secretion system pore protein FliP [Anaeromyxobacter diazotrophicus]GEJ59196.1 flagellar biosynthetic protein FliP [Anaeromyxobacter diazotrophicus]
MMSAPALRLALAAADPALSLSLGGGGSAPVKLFLLFTVLSFASALLVSVTCFTRIVIVLSFLRQALGTPQLPPNQVIIGLSLMLSFFVMGPTADRVWGEALGPYLDDRMPPAVAIEKASAPLREFMLRQTREQDLRLFYEISHRPRPARGDEIPMTVAMPAFMVSELTTSFRMGLFLYVPLLLVDVLVAAMLMSMGMMMVPPAMIALPLKVGVFLMADGWRLVVASLARSFQ